MPYKRKYRRRKTSRTRSRTARQAPAPRARRQPALGVLKVAQSGSTTGSVSADINFEDASELIALTGANGSFQASIFHGAADQSLELIVALATPLSGAKAGLTDAETKSFDPFDTSAWNDPAAVRGFNIVRLHRLANAHPVGAPNMVYSFNRSFKRRFRRIMDPNRSARLVIYARGNGNVSVAYDVGIRYVTK